MASTKLAVWILIHQQMAKGSKQYPPTKIAPRKWMVERLVSFWDGLLAGAMLVSGSVNVFFFKLINPYFQGLDLLLRFFSKQMDRGIWLFCVCIGFFDLKTSFLVVLLVNMLGCSVDRCRSPRFGKAGGG